MYIICFAFHGEYFCVIFYFMGNVMIFFCNHLCAIKVIL